MKHGDQTNETKKEILIRIDDGKRERKKRKEKNNISKNKESFHVIFDGQNLFFFFGPYTKHT